MATIFSLTNLQHTDKINIDELYEKKKQNDLSNLQTFDKILNRIHQRIKYTSKQNTDETCCWYVVPEFILGIPRYDHALCIAYVINKLTQNHFHVKYIHPNTLFISWKHYIPSYVRTEFKKKTGIIVNEFGEVIHQEPTNQTLPSQTDVPEVQFFGVDDGIEEDRTTNKSKPYTPIKPYKPSFFAK